MEPLSVEEAEITDKIRNLNVNKSSGPDVGPNSSNFKLDIHLWKSLAVH